MSRGDGTTTVDYVWHVPGGLPLLLQDGTNTYVYGLDLISIHDGSDMTYRLGDGLGSTVNLADEDGELVGEYTYDAYGNERDQTGEETEFSFAGEQNDPNGLDFLRARYYDPEIGRFLGGDPAGGGYDYAANNPISLTDPSGAKELTPGSQFNIACSTCAYGIAQVIVKMDGSLLILTGGSSPTQTTISAPQKAASTPPTSKVSAPTLTPSEVVFDAEEARGTGSAPPPPPAAPLFGNCGVFATLTDYGGGALTYGGYIECNGIPDGTLVVWAWLEDLTMGEFHSLVNTGPVICPGYEGYCAATGFVSELSHGGSLDYYQIYVFAFCGGCFPPFGSAHYVHLLQ
jgi:RHS repeat-associated protein